MILYRPRRATFPGLPLATGLPLGTGLPGARYQATRVHVPPHSTLVLYTDGLVESRAADISTGMTRLAGTLETISQQPVTQACSTLLTALAPSPADDIAVLMART
jgi:serine phosphatase RsbU (regulator of sigma subunit)